MTESARPTVGRIVHYTLADADAAEIKNRRLDMAGLTPVPVKNNPSAAGQVYPAMVVRTWGDTPGSAVNLQVFLDGEDVYWATSRTEGDGEGHWVWPPRV